MLEFSEIINTVVTTFFAEVVVVAVLVFVCVGIAVSFFRNPDKW